MIDRTINVTSVEIEMIVPTGATIRHGVTTQLDFSDIGKQLFFVSLMEEDDRCVMWSGESYEKAIVEAYELAADFGCKVHDRVAEGSAI